MFDVFDGDTDSHFSADTHMSDVTDPPVDMSQPATRGTNTNYIDIVDDVPDDYVPDVPTSKQIETSPYAYFCAKCKLDTENCTCHPFLWDDLMLCCNPHTRHLGACWQGDDHKHKCHYWGCEQARLTGTTPPFCESHAYLTSYVATYLRYGPLNQDDNNYTTTTSSTVNTVSCQPQVAQYNTHPTPHSS